jgi:Leucine-rich repeat (LRR) protein
VHNLEHAPNLSVLDLHNNKITDIPLSLMGLNGLKTLTLSNNDLSDINPRLSLLPNLVRINIEGNPLRRIKPAMRTAGAVELMKYLKLRLEETDIHAEEMRIDAAQGLPGAKSAY